MIHKRHLNLFLFLIQSPSEYGISLQTYHGFLFCGYICSTLKFTMFIQTLRLVSLHEGNVLNDY